jgi:TolB protein
VKEISMRRVVRAIVIAVALSAVVRAQPEPAATRQPDPAREANIFPGLPSLKFGTNIGHWLSQSKLDRAVMARFFTADDVARIKGWGMDHIRLPVDYTLFASDADRSAISEEGLGWIDRAVEWTRKAGLALVLDMHQLPGHSFMREQTNTIWNPGADREQAIAIWRALARRYRDAPHVVFELLNEPVAPQGQDEQWHVLARELIAAVRQEAPDNWIMVGSNRWSNATTFSTLPAFDDRRVIYTFHMYEPFLFTHQRASWAPDDVKNVPGDVPYPGPLPFYLLHTTDLIQEKGWMADRPSGPGFLREWLTPVFRFRDTHQVPIYCGEFGVVSNAPAADRLRWYRDLVQLFHDEGVSFSNWNYKSDNFGLVTSAGQIQEPLVAAMRARVVPTTAEGLGGFERSGDVGAVRSPGSARFDPATRAIELTGSGANIWGTADAFYFASKTLRGDIELQADVAIAPSNGDPHRKAGVMLRASREPDAPYADVVVHGDGLVSLQYRERKGGPTNEIKGAMRGARGVRLERHGTVISAHAAVDDRFQPIGALVLALPDSLEAGLIITAHDDARTERARFENVVMASRRAVPEAQRLVESTLETLTIATGERRIVYRAREHFEAPNWSRDGGSFLFNQGGALYTLPVEGGTPAAVDIGTMSGCNNDHGYSPDGRLIAMSCGPRGESRVHVVPAGGGVPRVLTDATPSYWHGWSPDGTTLAYVGRRKDEFDIYTVPVAGGAETRLTDAHGLDDGPDYSPDGQWIYFNSVRTGAMRLWRMRPDGRDQQQITDDAQYGDWFPHPSPDGRWIAFVSFDASVQGHPPNKDVVLRLVPADLSAPPTVVARLFGGQGTLNVPSWSPDSRAFAFVSYRLVAR